MAAAGRWEVNRLIALLGWPCLLALQGARAETAGRLGLTYQDLNSAGRRTTQTSQILDWRLAESLSSRTRLSASINLSFFQDPRNGAHLERSRGSLQIASPGLSLSGQLEPRQRLNLRGSDDGNERRMWNVSLTATPARLPRLTLSHARSETFNAGGDSPGATTMDTRLSASHTISVLQLRGERRWLRAGGLADAGRSDMTETGAGVRVHLAPAAWIQPHFSYGFLEARREYAAARAQTTRIHNADGSVQFRLPANFTAATRFLYRATRSAARDSGPTSGQEGQRALLIDRDLTARLTYRPAPWFTLMGLRERQVSSGATTEGVSDYSSAQMSLDLPLVGLTRFWTSLTQVWVIESVAATTPSRSAVCGMQGPLCRTIDLRASLNYAYSPESGEQPPRHRHEATLEARARVRPHTELRGELQTGITDSGFHLFGAERSVLRADLTQDLLGVGALTASYQRSVSSEPSRNRSDRLSVTSSLAGRRGLSLAANYIAIWEGAAFSGAALRQSFSTQATASLRQVNTVSVSYQGTDPASGSASRTWSLQMTRRF